MIAQLDLFDVAAPCNTAAIATATAAGEREIVRLDHGSRLRFADVRAAYNADKLAYGQGVTNPFSFRGAQWVGTGSGYVNGVYGGESCYRIINAADFPGPGEARPYREHDFFNERRPTWGSYHGMTAKHGKRDVVLVGPPIIIFAEEPSA